MNQERGEFKEQYTTAAEVDTAIQRIDEANAIVRSLEGRTVVTQEQSEQLKAAEQTTIEYIDDLLGIYTPEPKNEGQRRLYELATAVGGIDENIAGIKNEIDAMMQLTLDTRQMLIESGRRHVLWMSDDAMFHRMPTPQNIPKFRENLRTYEEHQEFILSRKLDIADKFHRGIQGTPPKGRR